MAVNFDNEFDQFLVNVASDLVFEMGAALIGSVATVIFSEYQNKRQFNENMDFGQICYNASSNHLTKL